MYVNEQKFVVRLVQGDIAGLIGDTVFDGQVGLIFKLDGGCGISGASLFGEVLLNEPLCPDLVDEFLTVTNEEGSHLGGEGSQGAVKQGV